MHRYLTLSSQPLLSFELYPFFVALGGAGGNQMAKLGQLADLLGRLPAPVFRRCEASARVPCALPRPLSPYSPLHHPNCRARTSRVTQWLAGRGRPRVVLVAPADWPT